MDPECAAEIVGRVADTLLEIREPGAAIAENPLDTPYPVPAKYIFDTDETRKLFFAASPEKYVLVISIPFRKGSHVAKRPTDFLPIIEQLEKLQDAGYVYGDVRAANTAFPDEEGGQGYLIDFDFSGKAGQVEYPTGYVRGLDDGDRIGREKEKIEKWHDWYALGRLIFDIHYLDPPAEGQYTVEFHKCWNHWRRVKACPSRDEIDELKKLLSRLQEQGWTVSASRRLQYFLNGTCS